jgi:hypothetical protein
VVWATHCAYVGLRVSPGFSVVGSVGGRVGGSVCGHVGGDGGSNPHASDGAGDGVGGGDGGPVRKTVRQTASARNRTVAALGKLERSIVGGAKRERANVRPPVVEAKCRSLPLRLGDAREVCRRRRRGLCWRHPVGTGVGDVVGDGVGDFVGDVVGESASAAVVARGQARRASGTRRNRAVTEKLPGGEP